MDNSKKNILVIEDETDVANALKFKIESSGMNATISPDGEDGLNKALSNHPDLIILDLILPKLDGMSILKNIRSDEWGKNVPVIILSNLGTGDEMKKAMEYNVKQFLTKTDFKLDDVVTKIKEALQ